MAKQRKPTKVLELRGAFKHNPDRGRARQDEPPPTGAVGDPPADLPSEVQSAWRDLVAQAHAGVLCAADREFMAYAATVVAETRRLARTGPGIIDPKLGVRFEAIIARLGMSPADRSRVQAAPGAPKNDPLAEFRAA